MRRKVLFEIRRFNGEDLIFIDNQYFDFAIDDESLKKVNSLEGEELKKVHENIKNYLLTSLAGVLGRPITMREVIEAIKTGYIQL